MNAKIPLLTIAATLSTGCIDELLKEAEEGEETEENEEEEEESADINGEWSLSSSEEGCYEETYEEEGVTYSYSYCVSFTTFNMTIVEGAITGSEVIAEMTTTSSNGEDEESYTYPYETSASNLSGEGTEYTVDIADGDVSLDCTLSGSTLECEATVDGELTLQATLTK